MTTFQEALFILIAIMGGGLVFTRDPLRQVLVLSVNGLLLTVLFMLLQAPDVALSELAVGSAGLPLILLVTLAKMREKNG